MCAWFVFQEKNIRICGMVYFEHELKVAQGNNHADAISLSISCEFLIQTHSLSVLLGVWGLRKLFDNLFATLRPHNLKTLMFVEYSFEDTK